MLTLFAVLEHRAILTWPGRDIKKLWPSSPLTELQDQAYSVASSESYHNNLVVLADNQQALPLLRNRFHNTIKLIYIDPPYNSGQTLANYTDKKRQSEWLSAMKAHLEVLRDLLRSDGFICCHIDDAMGPYLKVLLDEVMGHQQYLATLSIRVRYPQKTLRQDLEVHREIEYIHIYKKTPKARPYLECQPVLLDKFCYTINVHCPPRRSISLGNRTIEIYHQGDYEIIKGHGSPQGLKEIWASGTILDSNSSGRFYRDYLSGRVSEDGLGALYRVYGIGDDGIGFRYFVGPRRPKATKGKYFQGLPTNSPTNRKAQIPIPGFFDLAGAFGNCRHEGGVEFRSGKKPEILLSTLLRYFSQPGDWILDSYAGSGTTGAVAQKMRRRWIMIEREPHGFTHILPRLRAVIDGSDPTGVTVDNHWNGGGGFQVLCQEHHRGHSSEDES